MTNKRSDESPLEPVWRVIDSRLEISPQAPSARLSDGRLALLNIHCSAQFVDSIIYLEALEDSTSCLLSLKSLQIVTDANQFNILFDNSSIDWQVKVVSLFQKLVQRGAIQMFGADWCATV